MTTRTSRTALACALLATTCLNGTISAQTGPKPPPRQDTVSQTGVSYHSGAFSYQERDLVIGGGDFPNGLMLERSYLSSLDDAISVYSGNATQGWSNNLNARVGNHEVKFGLVEPKYGEEYFVYSVTIGSRSVGFVGGSFNPTGGFEGTYNPTNLGGEALAFTGSHASGRFTFTDSDGSVLVFNPYDAGGRAALAVSTQTAPDGTRLSFHYDNQGLRSAISSRGYALLFEYGDVPGGRARTKACAVNMAASYVAIDSACPANAQTVTYQYAPVPAINAGPVLIGTTNAGGEATSYAYTSRRHLGCIKDSGQSVCKISNEYSRCFRDQELLFDPEGMTRHEQVLKQTTATGEIYNYSFSPERQCPPARGGALVTMTSPGNATTTVTTNVAGLPTLITNPLRRATAMDYTSSQYSLPEEYTTLGTVRHAEGDGVSFRHDERGNITEERNFTKQGPGLDDIVRTAAYPANCTNRKTCNKPLYVVDARLQRVNFTYDSEHGGVLTEMQPAPSAGTARPLKVYSYVQKSAYVKDASGTLVPASSPIRMPASQTVCQTVAGSDSPTCDPGARQVVTTYEYGSDGTPNNLMLRGIVADAGSGRLNLRTCYAYDQAGNKISETAPRAGLTSCQ